MQFDPNGTLDPSQVTLAAPCTCPHAATTMSELHLDRSYDNGFQSMNVTLCALGIVLLLIMLSGIGKLKRLAGKV